MKPKREVIQGLWVSGRLSVMEQLSIASFLRNGHEYHLYTYNDVDNVPSGVVLKHGEEIVSRTEVFTDRDQELDTSYANFSDVFRYKLLLEKGGFWADLDIVCLRPFDFQTDFVFGSQAMQDVAEETKRFGSSLVNGNVIKAPIGTEIMKFCYEKSTGRATVDREWFELGPPLLTEAVKRFGLQTRIRPPCTFNPIDWWSWNDVINEQLAVRTRTKLKFLLKGPVYAVHLWNSMWNRDEIDKSASFPRNCLYEKLKRLYLQPDAEGETFRFTVA
jgi:hypothetical protein